MTPNELLLWLSARKEGSWPQFRGAVATLDLASSSDETGEGISLQLHQRIRFNLERVGHVEFDAAECEDSWRVVPPTLALSQDKDRMTGVLCGARTLPALERMEREVSGMKVERATYMDCPDVIRIQAVDAQSLIDLARRVGISYQLDAPTALLSHLPPVDSLRVWNHAQLPVTGKEWEVKQFIIEKKMMRWRTVTLQEANAPEAQGLFCFTRFQMPQYFLREGRESIKLPGAVGKYLVLYESRKRVLRYDRKDRALTLPAIFQPPPLTERALVLCSGFPPLLTIVRSRRMLTYREIPEEVAGMAAELLRQDLI